MEGNRQVEEGQCCNIQLAIMINIATCFCELLSLGCINLENLCAHQQVEVLRIPKYPQHVKFGLFVAKLWQFKENRSFPK